MDYDDGRFDLFTDFSKGILLPRDKNYQQDGGNSSYGNQLTCHYLSDHCCFPTKKEERTLYEQIFNLIQDSTELEDAILDSEELTRHYS